MSANKEMRAEGQPVSQTKQSTMTDVTVLSQITDNDTILSTIIAI